MRLAATLLVAVLVAACSQPTTALSGAPASATTQGPTILASDGGVMRPISNGGRLPLKGGWATVRFSTPLELESELEVRVYDIDGKTIPADVTVVYASIDMDHGNTTEHGVLHEGCYRVPLSFLMPGAWRLVIHVARGGADETLTLVLPEVGL